MQIRYIIIKNEDTLLHVSFSIPEIRTFSVVSSIHCIGCWLYATQVLILPTALHVTTLYFATPLISV